jgi:hypothetical protein
MRPNFATGWRTPRASRSNTSEKSRNPYKD